MAESHAIAGGGVVRWGRHCYLTLRAVLTDLLSVGMLLGFLPFVAIPPVFPQMQCESCSSRSFPVQKALPPGLPLKAAPSTSSSPVLEIRGATETLPFLMSALAFPHLLPTAEEEFISFAAGPKLRSWMEKKGGGSGGSSSASDN